MTTIAIGALDMPWGQLTFRRSQGGGFPLLLLHPLALSAKMWELVQADLGPQRDVIAVDARGHGDSRWDGKPFSIAELAGDVALLLDHLGIAQADVTGMSMGGGTAMTVAATYPDRVRRLALCDTTAWYGADAPEKWADRARMAETTPSRRDLIPFQTTRWFSDRFRAEHPDMVEQVAEIFIGTNAAAHAAACRALGAFDARGIVGRIKAATLAITGEEDYATPPAMGAALAEAIPGAAFRQWPAVRHFSVLENADLRSFLAQHLEGKAS